MGNLQILGVTLLHCSLVERILLEQGHKVFGSPSASAKPSETRVVH